MPYEFYKVLHFTGMFLLVMSVGGMGVHILNGGTRENFPSRKWLGMLHGMGLALILVAGFGLLARLYPGQFQIPVWVYPKLGVWLFMGASPALIYRFGAKIRIIWWIILASLVAAAMFAVYKPSL